MESSGGDRPTATDATESALGLDGEETLSERESVGARQGPGLPNGGGKEAPSSSSSARTKRKHNVLGPNQGEVIGPVEASSSSGDSTWSVDNLDGHHQFLSSRNKDDHSEHSVTSAGIEVIRQPRGVLRLRKQAQNTESLTGNRDVSLSNGVPKLTEVPRRNKRRKSNVLKENRVGGDDPVGRFKTENGTYEHDSNTKFCSETEFSVEKQSHLSGDAPNAVQAHKESCRHVEAREDVSVEEDAARMLCSLSDKRSAGPPVKSVKSLDRSSEAAFPQHSRKKIKDKSGPARLLRKRDGKTPFRKRRPRRHFYEVCPRDVDPFRIVKERIRVFWPLDETWYFGLVKEYDPVTRLHHVRYDDKDEEWINLQNERIKLLLLPGEARKRSNHISSRSIFKQKDEESEREGTDGSNTGSSDSEPIGSWLVRSNQGRSAISGNISKQTHSSIVPAFVGQKHHQESVKADQRLSKVSMAGSHANGVPDVTNGRTTDDKRFRFVYSRKRVCRKKNGFHNVPDQGSSVVFTALPGTESATGKGVSVTYAELVLSLPLKPTYKFILESCSTWLSITCLLHRRGILVPLWPVVHLDILIVDNALGLKQLRLETCLRSAVSLFCLLVGSFSQCSGHNSLKDSRTLCTSIRFQISGVHGKGLVFLLFSSVGMGKSKWKNLRGKLQPHCSNKNLAVANSKYTNKMPCMNGTVPRVIPSILLFSKGSCSDPVICCHDEWRQFAEDDVEMSATPSLLLCHHLKLLTESNLTNGSQQPVFTLDEDHRQSTAQQKYYSEPSGPACQSCSMNLRSSTDGPWDMGIAGCENHLSSASRESNTSERSVNLKCSDDSTGDANTCRKNPDQNGRYVSAEPCPSNDSIICSLNRSEDRCLSIKIPQNKTSAASDDKSHEKDEKDMRPMSNLVQELNEDPIGRTTPTAPRTTYHRNRFTSISRTFGDGSKLLPEDLMLNTFAGGSKKPRTQISPRSEEFGIKHKGHFRKTVSHSSAKTNDVKRLPDNSRSEHSSPESVTCVANVLVTVGDKGWREYDTQITVDSDGQNERLICVTLTDGTKYAHKVCQVLQPGATNRYTHAMIWKGGTEWCLEFPDRGQWSIFKQMHGECYSHNIRAASVKNIPIPGVRFIETYDDNDPVSFVRSEDYIGNIGTDAEMALDESRVIYDMDTDDEEWVSSRKKSSVEEGPQLTEDLFERVVDKLEKFAYSHTCNELTIDQMKELDIDNAPMDTIKMIHAYWQEKRQKKGMPLIRHFQPALWVAYEQELQKWESTVYKMQGSSNGFQEKKLPSKPALFAFCLKPRGLQIPHKGPKQRSHKKLMSSGCHSFSREQEGYYRSGRKYSEYVGDGRTGELYETGSIYSPTGYYSPRFSVRTDSPRAFDVSERSSTPRFFRTNSTKRSAGVVFYEDHQSSPSFRYQRLKRGTPDHWNTVLHDWQNSKHQFAGGSQSPRIDIEELKLRDAASAAQHAATMARLKRERAHQLMHKADLALHKATVALMLADAIRSSGRDAARGGRSYSRDEER